MLDSVINPVHILIIMAIAIVVFGPKRLPEMGRKIGQVLREFQSATSEIRSQTGIDEIANSMKDIKSGLSLTATDNSSSAPEIVAGEPVAPTSAAAEAPWQPATVTDAPLETPVSEPPTDVPSAGQPARDATTVSADVGEECGVEAFGRLERGSASSRVRAAAD
jgi:TatA/E family protein of Tat protein translocase